MFRGTASSVKGVESKVTARQQFTIWPEWSDADVNSEKWVSEFMYGSDLPQAKSIIKSVTRLFPVENLSGRDTYSSFVVPTIPQNV